MKKLQMVILGVAFSTVVFGQTEKGQDPYVKNIVVKPAPFTKLNEPGTVSFEIGNSGNGEIDGSSSTEKIGFSITLSRLIPSDIVIKNIIKGSGADYFDYKYIESASSSDPSQKTPIIVGIQKEGAVIGSLSLLDLILPVIYTGPAETIEPADIGANINIYPATAYNSSNDKTNDAVSTFTYYQTPVSGPVELLNFNAVKNASTSLLTWSTSSEINSKEFEVYRSTDGISWVKLDAVAAAGNSSTTKNYQYVDGAPSLTKKNYYKLKVVDLDATFKESSVRWVEFGTVGLITLYPNPVRSKLVVNGIQNAKEVVLYDAVGKLLQRVRVTGNSEELEMSKYAAGVYQVQVLGENGETLHTSKVLKD